MCIIYTSEPTFHSLPCTMTYIMEKSTNACVLINSCVMEKGFLHSSFLGWPTGRPNITYDRCVINRMTLHYVFRARPLELNLTLAWAAWAAIIVCAIPQFYISSITATNL